MESLHRTPTKSFSKQPEAVRPANNSAALLGRVLRPAGKSFARYHLVVHTGPMARASKKGELGVIGKRWPMTFTGTSENFPTCGDQESPTDQGKPIQCRVAGAGGGETARPSIQLHENTRNGRDEDGGTISPLIALDFLASAVGDLTARRTAKAALCRRNGLVV